MPDTDQSQIDLDTLTDDQVMNLTPEEIEGLGSEQESGAEDVQPQSGADAPDVDEADDAPNVDDQAEDEQPGEPDPDAEDEPEVPAGDEPKGEDAPEGDDVASEAEPEGKAKDEEKPAEAKAKPDGKPTAKELKAADTAESVAAVDFFKKVSAPFKANGKDMQVRSAEDVVRLMQMGVDYSRNMQLMKPMKAMDSMLKTHGLNDPGKLSFLIDVKNGKTEAIQKLLKDLKIDPLDLNTGDDAPVYKQSNYQGDPKDVEFQEAIDTTLSRPGGKELISDVNANWDEKSKEALREEPAIFENLLAQKESGVYQQVNTELEYQRSLNFLTNVPFLQAYHQVSQAMEKAGVFGTKIQDGQDELESNPTPPVPLATGSRRKAAPKPKTVQPNPPSSASQPRSAPPSGSVQNEPDYATMSDAEFMKLGEPQ
jgi:hypothetical protein